MVETSNSRLVLLGVLGGLGLWTLGGCGTTRVESGAVLAPGQSASFRILGPRAAFEFHNLGEQALEYRLEDAGSTSGGIVEPNTQIAESRGRGDLTLTVTNPGPGRAQAVIETTSRGGIEINQGASRGAGSPVN